MTINLLAQRFLSLFLNFFQFNINIKDLSIFAITPRAETILILKIGRDNLPIKAVTANFISQTMQSNWSSRKSLQLSPSANELLKELSQNVVDLEVMLKSVAEDSTEALNQIKRLINSQYHLEGDEMLAESTSKPTNATVSYDTITANTNQMIGLFKKILNSSKVERERMSARSLNKSQKRLEEHRNKSKSKQQANHQTMLRTAVVTRDLGAAIDSLNRGLSNSNDPQLKFDSRRLAALAKYQSQDSKFRGVLNQIANKTQRFETQTNEQIAQLQGSEIEGLRAEVEMRRSLCERLKQQNNLLKEYAKLKDAYIAHNNQQFKEQVQKYNVLFQSLKQQIADKQQQLEKLTKDNDQLIKINAVLRRGTNDCLTCPSNSGIRAGMTVRTNTPHRTSKLLPKEQRSMSTFNPSDYSTCSIGRRAPH